jgi:hypothetical protein
MHKEEGSMNRFWRYALPALGAALLALAFAGATASKAASASATTFSGRAYVLGGPMNRNGQETRQAQIEGIGLGSPLVDTGYQQASAFDVDACVLSYPDDQQCLVQTGLGDPTQGAFTATVLHASTSSHGNHSDADVFVAESTLKLTGASPLTPVVISASAVQAEVQAKCNDGSASVSGSAELASLSFDTGLTDPFAVDVNIPNQHFELPLPGRTEKLSVDVVIGEADSEVAGNNGKITVNAVHVTIRNPITMQTTEFVIGAVHADIVCAVATPNCDGGKKVTGGGWVPKGTGKASLAVSARVNSTKGHAIYVDHNTRTKLQSIAVDPLTFDLVGFAVITGTAKVNGSGNYKFKIRVKDNGHPGRGNDRYELMVVGFPLDQPETPLGGGNLTLHKPCVA